MKPLMDITTQEDVVNMVNGFYAKVKQDDLLGPIFNDVAKLNWEEHLPKMYRFWNNLLFADCSYKGNPFAAHVSLPISKRHFDRWVALFDENIDELFAGDVAAHTKLRARSIAHVFQSKLQYLQALTPQEKPL